MKYLKTYEGLFDFFKKKKKDRDYFSDEEYNQFKNSVYIDQLVKVEKIGQNSLIKSIEVFAGKASRSSLSVQYSTITKQDNEYKLITHESVHQFATDNNARLKRYKTLDEVIFDAKKHVLYCLVAPFIEPTKRPNISWNNVNISEEQFNESRSLVDDYSVLSNGKLNIERLNMLLDDYYIINGKSEEWLGNNGNFYQYEYYIKTSKSILINYLENYFNR